MTFNQDPPDGARLLQTVSTTLQIISLLEEHNGATAIELTEELDVSKSAVYSHLTTLADHDFVSKQGNTYQLSFRFLTLG